MRRLSLFLPTLLVQLEATALCPASYSRSVQRARKKAYVPLLEFNLIVRMVTKAFAALFVCIPAFACMMGGGVIGSGKEPRQTREVDNFTQLELLGVGRVEITIGDLRPLEIRGDDNILSMIETKVTDGRLIIRATRSIRPGQPLIIKATVSDLTAIMLGGAGEIATTGIANDSLHAEVAGAGEVTLSRANQQSGANARWGWKHRCP